MLRPKVFTYRGHEFEIRASVLEKGWAVQIFENNKPVLMHAARSDVGEEHLPEVKALFHPN